MKANISKQTKVICSNCGQHALASQKTDKLSGGIEHTYFQCSACSYKATVYYTNAEIRAEMAKQRQRYRDSIKTARENAPQLQALMDTLKAEIELTGLDTL